MEDMKQRIQRGDVTKEKTDAIKVSIVHFLPVREILSGPQAMCEIAADRARKLSDQ